MSPDITCAAAAAQGLAEGEISVVRAFTADTTTRVRMPPPEPDTSDQHRGTLSTPTSRRRDEWTDPAYTNDERAYSPTRRLEIDGHMIEADAEIQVSASQTGYAVADITIYNLDMSTWGSIARPSAIRIGLGWDDLDDPIFDGRVMIKRRRRRMHNRAYVIRGRARKADALSQPFVRTYNNLSPHRIVDRIIGESETLTRGYISTESAQIDGHLTTSGARSLGGTLDNLAQRAARQTGETWVWYLEGGDLSFHPLRERTADPITFGAGKSLLRATPVGLTSRRIDEQPLEAVFRCEPTIHRGTICRIVGKDDVPEDALYRVNSWVHESKSTTGRHHTLATLEPLYKTIDEIRTRR